jgi:hypothetical protein
VSCQILYFLKRQKEMGPEWSGMSAFALEKRMPERCDALHAGNLKKLA